MVQFFLLVAISSFVLEVDEDVQILSPNLETTLVRSL